MEEFCLSAFCKGFDYKQKSVTQLHVVTYMKWVEVWRSIWLLCLDLVTGCFFLDFVFNEINFVSLR